MARSILTFENYLSSHGIRFYKELHGITPGRLAAQKAGLGIIRKNNFFYSRNGSWVIIDTWLIDCEMELIESAQYTSCPEGCTSCIDVCPTKALSKPYCTDLMTCITKLTWGINELPPEWLRSKLKSWIYGCDECQNACPMSMNTWESGQNYPGLEELAEKLSLKKILHMEENKLTDDLPIKFWFIRPESLWIWKVNVLRAMANWAIGQHA